MKATIAGDYSTVMGLRCESKRHGASDQALFVGQTERFVRLNGQPSVGSISQVPRRLTIPAGLSDAHEYQVVLRYPTGRSGAIDSLVGIENGTLRICGVSPPQAGRLWDAMPLPKDAGATSRSPRGLMPSIPAGASVMEDHADAPRPTTKMVDAWTTAWRMGTHGGGRVTADRFATIGAAKASAMSLVRSMLSDVQGVFTVDAMPGATALRVVADDWLQVQASTVGPYVDYVISRFGTTVVTIAVSNLPTGSSHGEAAELASQVVDLAKTHT